MHLSDLLERQRDKLLSAPLLPGGTFDLALHPARHPLRDAFVGSLLTLLLGALTWCVRHVCAALGLKRKELRTQSRGSKLGRAQDLRI